MFHESPENVLTPNGLYANLWDSSTIMIVFILHVCEMPTSHPLTKCPIVTGFSHMNYLQTFKVT